MAHRLSRTARGRAFRSVGKYHSSHKGTMNPATLRPRQSPRIVAPRPCPPGSTYNPVTRTCQMQQGAPLRMYHSGAGVAYYD